MRMRIRRQLLLQHFDYEDISERELTRVAGLSHTTIQNYLNAVDDYFVPEPSIVETTRDGVAA